MSRDSRRSGVIFAGPFPPPVHGASTITADLFNYLNAQINVQKVNLGARPASRPIHHLRRALAHLLLVKALVSGRRSFHAFYLSLPAGFGLLYVYPALLTARIFGYSIYMHHHSFAYIHKKNRLLQGVVRVAGERHVSIALCSHMENRLMQTYPKILSIFVLSNAWSIGSSNIARRSCSPGLHIGHLSNLTSAKGIGIVCKTFEHLAKGGTDAYLHIGGPFADKFARATVLDIVERYPARVTYVGYLEPDAKDSFLAGIDVFFFPSRYWNEAEPLVLDEALSAGCKVVALETGCIVQENYPGKSVMVLEKSADAARCAEALLQVRHSDPGTECAEIRRAKSESQLSRFVSKLQDAGWI